MALRVIDLNCDLGEGMETDEYIMPYISSANIACGFHAGDADTMRRTVMSCLAHGVAIGAHPSFPDRENFGRKEMELAPEILSQYLLEQLEMLQKICTEMGAVMRHVKPHGALYNMSARRSSLASIIAQCVLQFNPNLNLFGLAGSCSITEAAAVGLPVVHEFFADRTYQADGSLTPRNMPNALIEDEGKAVVQALNIASKRTIFATNGQLISPAAANAPASICLHGDGSHALVFAKLIHQSLDESGFSIQAF